MATQVLISPEEYLKMPFEGPGFEYIEGQLVERPMPTFLHCKMQALLCMLFAELVKKFGIQVASEMRHPLAVNRRYRVSDVAVYSAQQDPFVAYPAAPPIVAIEILSPEDRMSEVLQKCTEYQTWGVPHIWLIDPENKKLYIYDATGLHPAQSLPLPQYDFAITLADLNLQ